MLIYIGNMPILSDVFVAIQYFSVRTVTIVTVKVNKHRWLLLLLDPLIGSMDDATYLNKDTRAIIGRPEL